MGLDDEVSDSGIIEAIEKKIKHFVLTYSGVDMLTPENIQKWEERRCYTGYSIAFHMLRPLYQTVCLDGLCVEMTPEI